MWILYSLVVTSKKKLTWGPPVSHFYYFLGYHLQDQSLFQEKKLTEVPLDKAFFFLLEGQHPPPKKKETIPPQKRPLLTPPPL